MDFSQLEKDKEENLKQILQDLKIEDTYFENIMTQGAMSNEYTAAPSEYFKLPEPSQTITFEEIKVTSNKIKPILSALLMIIDLNEITDLDDYPQIKSLTYAILLIACTSGCLKSDKKFEVTEYKENTEKYSEKSKEIKDAMDMLPVAKNFCALSVINYIRFNHHFPKEKIDLIKKALIGVPENQINDFLEVDSKSLNLFYKYPFQASKLINEWAFFYTNVNKNIKISNEDKSSVKLLHYGIIRDYTSPDQIVIIRNSPTTNCFLILDLVYVFLNYLDSHEILGLLPNIKVFKTLMNIRAFLKKHPFSCHPSRYYFNIQFDKDEFNKIVNSYQENIRSIGNLIYKFCMEEGGSLGAAKSILKYENHSLNEYKDIFEIYKITKESQISLNEEQKTQLTKILSPKIKIPQNLDDLQAKNKEIKKEIFNEDENLIINEKEN